MLSNPDHLGPPKRPEPPVERLRKPSLNLRIEAYRNNLAQNQQQPSPSSFSRDFPSPGPSNGSASPLNTRFPNPAPDTAYSFSASESSPVIGASASAQSSIHNRSNSYNVLGSTATTPSQPTPSPRHKSSNSGNTPNFTFSFGAKTNTPARAKPDSNLENRRASQIISHSGFINRNVSTSFPMNLAKNWKAYKAEIKGSKLYLYKPPNEKAAAVRDLFPSEHGGIEDVEENEENNSAPADANSLQNQDQRRKRLFWGPGRHPDMVLNPDGSLSSGTSEALMYELVFAATFAVEDEEGWKKYAEAVLLCLPILAGRERFEVDIVAVIDRYLRYTDSDAMLEYRRRRVEWLVATYIEYHYGEAVPPSLDVLVKAFSLEMNIRPPAETPFKLPKPPATTPRTPLERPSLVPKSSFSRDPSENPHGGTYADLRHKATMSRERTMAIDTNVLAQSLELAFIKLAYDASQLPRVQPILASLGPTGPWAVFSATERRPHWLTHFIVAQIVAESDRSVSVSSTHSRALTISKWTRVADHARLAGNECMWKAILDALTSKPVARLEKVWRRVDTADRMNVEAWVRGENGVKKSAQNQIRWLNTPASDLTRDAQELKASSPFQVPLMRRIHKIIRSVSATLQNCNVDRFVVDHADVLDLFYLWDAVITKPTSLKLIDEYVVDSLKAEPIQIGRLAQLFHQPRSQNYHLHALVPFTFPEPLPSLAFLDRSELVRLRKESLDKHGNTAPHDIQMEHLSRMKFFPSEHVRSHWSGKEGVELDDTTFRLFNGEMIVKVVKESQPSSRPASFFDNGATSLSRRPSRAPSIRVTPQAASTLERKSSAARRQSMPLLNNSRNRINQTENMATNPPDLSVPIVIVGGTIERLVDVLVRGLDYVMAATSDDNGEMALMDRRAKGLRIDRSDYSKTWWSTYRSFLTPDAFIAMLRKQYRVSVISLRQSPQASSQDVADNVNQRIAILTVLNEWFMDGGGLIDVLDQPELYNEVYNWLRDTVEFTSPKDCPPQREINQNWQELETARSTLLSLMEVQAKRPTLRHIPTFDSGVYEPSIRSYGAQPPEIDRMTAQELVEQLDAIGAVGIRGLQAEDLLSCMEILEVQSRDKTGWILLTDLPTISQDEMIIQNIYFHLTLVEPSPLLADFPITERLTGLAQPSIRTMLYCFDEARTWATAVLAQPGISMEVRARRMEVFLQALEMCRILSAKTDGVAAGSPVIRSFVETVLTTAILSPESRMFQRAWYHTAIQRRLNSMETLESFLRPSLTEPLPFPTGFKLAVDFGWMVERLLELVSMPDALVNTGDALGSVVNFEKRRHLYTFVLNMPTLASPRPSKQRSQLNNVDLVRLNNMYEWAAKILQDGGGNLGVSQVIKDEAQRENAHTSAGAPPRKYPKPFAKIVLLQQEKNKRDRHIRDRLLREKRLEQQKKEKQSVPYDKAMDAARKTKTNKRASMNPFMRVVRPLSTAFPFGNAPIATPEGLEGRKWTLEELSSMSGVKPSLSIDLAGARIEERFSNVRPFIFTLDTEDGVKYYFQATRKRDMNAWITQMSKISKNTSEKRRTYLGPPTANIGYYKVPQNRGSHPTAVFCVPLDFLVEREYGSADISAVPSFFERCLEEVETRGFSEDGIYRVSGSKLQIDRIKSEVDQGKTVDIYHEDIHNICSLIKLWIREIPGGLMSSDGFWSAVDAVQRQDHGESINRMRHAIMKIPLPHLYVLRRLMEHLTIASTHEDQTRMAEKQFSLVFGQTVLTPPDQTINAINAGIQYGNRVVELMLIYYHAIFEVEADEEDDGEGADASGEMHFLEELEEVDEEQVQQ